MSRIKTTASSTAATLIGDVVGSRDFSDRRGLHRRLSKKLTDIADGAIDPPRLTVGDEFQGSYRTVGAAIDNALSLRLALGPEIDVRFGIGWGVVTKLDAATGLQDGPGWWSAREAIEWVASAQQQSGFLHIRTTYRRSGSNGPEPAAVNAALMCRDHLLGSLDDRSLRILAGLRAGGSKKELAMTEGISASAVSQRTGRDGLDLIVAASQRLRDVA